MGNWKKAVAKTRGLDDFAGVPNKSINVEFRLRHELKKAERERDKKRVKELEDEIARLRRL